MPEPLLQVEHLAIEYPMRTASGGRGTARVVNDVSFSVEEGETFAIVGESGCGKTTVARGVCGLVRPTAGRVLLDGEDLTGVRGRAGRLRRRQIQMIFQDPYGSLHPRKRAGEQIEEAWRVDPSLVPKANWAWERDRLLEMVGLRAADARSFPHQFSGGQRQRIVIARALAARPRVLLCDEPVSALDVSIQAQVVNLLLDLQQELRLSYVFISHDIALVSRLAHRTAVMFGGQFVEEGETAEVLAAPKHAYTKSLLAAVPTVPVAVD